MTLPLSETFGLSSPDGRSAQLLTVSITGEILGPMLRLTVRQTWRNTSGAPMAAQLRFPLTWDQHLMDLRMERPQHSERLQQVQRDSRSSCRCALGVLGTGEQVTLSWRITQSLQVQGGSLRWQIPAGLAPHSPRGLQLGFDIHDPVAQGTVGSPSCEFQRVRHGNGLRLSLPRLSGLDKDLTLTVHGLKDKLLAVASPDLAHAGQLSLLAAVCTHNAETAPVRTASTPRQPLRLKLLLDQSAHMNPDRLTQIRAALDHLLADLQDEDQASLSRFGERVQHDLPRVQACTGAYRKRLRALARHADPCGGQTTPESALQAALTLTDEDEQTLPQADILLLTASPVGAIEALLGQLQAAGHRLHVLTLGAASQSLWADLARASGGSCEALAPGQHVEPTLARLIARLQQLQAVNARLVMEDAHIHSTTVTPAWMTDGETLQLWAQVQADGHPNDLTGQPTLEAGMHWQHGDMPGHTLPAVPVLWDAQGDVSRLAWLRQALALPDENERQALLKTHGLYWPDSSRLSQPVASTTATATHKGFASAPPVRAAVLAPPAPAPRPTMPPTTAAPAPVTVQRPAVLQRGGGSLPDWLHTLQQAGNPLMALVQGFNTQAESYTQFRAALSGTLKALPSRSLDGLVLQLSRKAGNPGRVWALLLHWLHAEHELPLSPAALALLTQELATTPVAVRNDINAILSESASAQRKVA
jgi:hypothetical protein